MKRKIEETTTSTITSKKIIYNLDNLIDEYNNADVLFELLEAREKEKTETLHQLRQMNRMLKLIYLKTSYKEEK